MKDTSGWSRRKILQVALGGLATAACGSSLPASPASPLGSGSSDGALGQSGLLQHIDTFVVLCMENRSFDHWLGSRSLLEGRGVDGLTGNESNLAPDGSKVPVFHQEQFKQVDLPHSWNAAHSAFNGGRNDGFVTGFAGKNQTLPMGYFTRAQAPISYALADAGGTCDRWFSSLLGPTWPNRAYLHGATSHGHKAMLPMVGFKDIFSELNRAGVSNANYFHDVPWALGGYLKRTGYRTIERFYEDALGGTLPSFCLIDPRFAGSNANDNHPDHDVRLGEALVGSIYAALSRSPQWSRCLFVVTYDENGGFFDHVAPPTTTDANPDFQRLGFRIPALVAGPFVKPGSVISTQLENVSILSTLTKRFHLTPLNDRVTASADLSTVLDPALIGNGAEPRLLPPIQLSMAQMLAVPPPTEDEHPEMTEALLENPPPPELDRRNDPGLSQRLMDWYQELGVVRS